MYHIVPAEIWLVFSMLNWVRYVDALLVVKSHPVTNTEPICYAIERLIESFLRALSRWQGSIWLLDISMNAASFDSLIHDWLVAILFYSSFFH